MNQAVTVPMTAQRAVTTTVRLTVFRISWAVSPRKRSGSRVPHPTWTAWVTRKTSGRTTATVATNAPSDQERGMRRLLVPPMYPRGRRDDAPGVTGGRSLAGVATTEVTAARCTVTSSWASWRSLIASAPVPNWAIVMELGWSWSNGVSPVRCTPEAIGYSQLWL